MQFDHRYVRSRVGHCTKFPRSRRAYYGFTCFEIVDRNNPAFLVSQDNVGSDAAVLPVTRLAVCVEALFDSRSSDIREIQVPNCARERGVHIRTIIGRGTARTPNDSRGYLSNYIVQRAWLRRAQRRVGNPGSLQTWIVGSEVTEQHVVLHRPGPRSKRAL
jgi:hypothetical protein